MSMKQADSIVDLAQRRLATDPSRSFIVQAPAGSGKTELLTQRFLALLGTVAQPEEIIAITFTKKAAAEMRARVVAALNQAQSPQPPAEPHLAERWLIAQPAVRQDRDMDWQLSSNPNRLQILTIDALCAALTRQMPVLAEFGSQPNVSDDPVPLYRQAARNLLGRLDSGEAWAGWVELLVRHLDNNWPIIEEFLIDMLSRRDQWLRHVMTAKSIPDLRPRLEAGLQRIIRQALQDLASAIPADITDELIALMQFASRNLLQDTTDLSSHFWADANTLPEPDSNYLPAWLAIVDLLLTDKGKWRATVTKNNGFPPGKATAPMKERHAALIERLQNCDDLQTLFSRLRLLPAPGYTENQWRLLEALTSLLPLAVAELKLVFREKREVDFTEIAQAAVQALGHHDAPTNLALKLDYRIRHLLVDEFQDTSLSQFELLERLTAGWQPDDGHTLFLVGDPMQSIYRFREANVGLFLWAREHGLTNVPLTPLTLQVNFRSAAPIVTWINQAFSTVLPARENITTGAVTYSPSVPLPEKHRGTGRVTIHPFIGHEPHQEATRILEIIKAARGENIKTSIAVLVKARHHLGHLVQILVRERLPFTALEIAPLAQMPVIHDLWALTRALLHPADRVAWLAVLRAPWCGLMLSDLHSLLSGHPQLCVWQALTMTENLSRISENGRARLRFLHEALAPFIQQRRRLSLRRYIEAAWTALSGPACLIDDSDLSNAEVYFDLLDKIAIGGDIPRLELLDEKIRTLFAQPDPNADGSLQLMTIHKAKGLEFDVVIVPGLGRMAPRESSRLLHWQELATESDTNDLLLAPIKETGQKHEPITGFLRTIEQEKARHESARLLYVAATRAKQSLHLLGHIPESPKDSGEIRLPHSNSLLAQLWPAVEKQFVPVGPIDTSDIRHDQAMLAQTIRRLPNNWAPPLPEPCLPTLLSPDSPDYLEPLEFVWAHDTIRYVGILVHRWLKRIATEGEESWNNNRIISLRKNFITYLRAFGIPASELDAAANAVITALCNTLDDPRGQWILKNHSDSRSEWAITGVAKNAITQVVIDRTFIDEQGDRWVIDYKTGTHLGGDIEAFLHQERARYRPQLDLYAQLLATSHRTPIKLGLYFPLLKAWLSWNYGETYFVIERPDPHK